jgi:O-antigen/teichoic acid export membrane protein
VTQNIAKNTLYLTLASIGQKVMAFVYFLFVARIMMPENTGAYFLALSITTTFFVIADFGINSVVIRDVAKQPEQALDLARRSFGLKIPLVIVAIMGAVLTGRILGYSPEVQRLIQLACVVMALDSVSTFFYGLLRAFHVLKYEAIGIFIGQSITVSFGAFVLITNPSLTLLVCALIFGSSFNAFFSASRMIPRIGWKVLVPAFDKKLSLKLLGTASAFALAAIFVKVYSYIDTVIISKLIGTAAVGIYSIAYKFTYAFQFLPLAFVAALYPGMSSLIEQKDHQGLREMFQKGMWYMAIVGFPIALGMWSIAEDAVLLAGDDYVHAGPVLGILIFALIPLFIDYPIGSLLNAADRQKTKTAIMGFTMVVNAICNFTLIPLIGLKGAAISAVISFTFMFFAGLIYVPKIIKGYKYSDLIKVIGPVFMSALVMAIVARTLNLYIDYVLVIPIAAIVYIAMLLVTKSVPKQYAKAFIKLFKGVVKPYVAHTTHDD